MSVELDGYPEQFIINTGAMKCPNSRRGTTDTHNKPSAAIATITATITKKELPQGSVHERPQGL